MLALYCPRASIVLHAMLFVWTKCQYPQFLETCEKLELVVQTSLKFQFYECPVLGSYFLLVIVVFCSGLMDMISGLELGLARGGQSVVWDNEKNYH